MDWLNMQWVSTYWMPLVIALVIGFILGWLLTGLSPRRKNGEYEAQLAELESKSKKTERDLTDARKQLDSAKAATASTESTLGEVRKQLSSAQADAQRLTDEKAAMEADVQSSNIELADLKMQLALLQDQFDKTKSGTAAEIDQLRSNLAAATSQVAALSAERDGTAAELATVKNSSDSALHSLSTKDAALNEAYQRAVNLQRALEDREASFTAAQAELTSLRTDVSALNSIKAELENRLQSARGDVAGEMAVLTSTMIKMKEDQLSTANARIAELMSELNTLKSNQAAG